MSKPVELESPSGTVATSFISFPLGNGSGPATTVSAKAAQEQTRMVRRISCFMALFCQKIASGQADLFTGSLRPRHKAKHPPDSKPPRSDALISVVEKTDADLRTKT